MIERSSVVTAGLPVRPADVPFEPMIGILTSEAVCVGPAPSTMRPEISFGHQAEDFFT